MADLQKLVDDLSNLTLLEATQLGGLLKAKWQQSTAGQNTDPLFTDIKNDLSAWPDNVINQWLFHLAKRSDTGWPPPNPLGFHPWAFILGHRPIPWWREVTWKLEMTDCGFAALCADTKAIVVRMLTEKSNGTMDEETRRRFDKAVDHILKNAAFEEPLIAMKMSDGLSILDGNHRISAFCWLQMMTPEEFEKLGFKKPAQEQQIWIGTHGHGETPLDLPPDIDSY